MEISILLMEQIAELFLMILMGYIIVKTGLLKGEDSKVISKIVLYLVIPCVIINAFQVDYTSEKVKELLLVFAASVLLQVILLAAVWGAGKVLKLNEVETTSIYYSNSGNLIVPLVTFILGKEWVLYGCVFMSVQLVFLWTHGKNTISREGKWDWKKIVFNVNMIYVNMISVFAGVVLFFTKIRLPEIVDQALSSVGSMIGPASMIVTGMLIAEMNLRNIFENVKVYFISFLRLVVIPVISLAILKISGLVNIHPDGKKLLLIVFLAVITPSASTITQMCQVYGNDSKYASAINVMTTLLSIITMPLMVLLYQTMM
ncbi:AEC family transporter [Dorea longicatena]|uniref:AEC family transporter n=1 Tax=Dorea longicatena TaxID=88431 RepID=UPI00156E8434|nr:AEC family transporter [Dorea longicatena]NSC49461.1 AEC family transporter [Dorea longicatena]NSD25605.1 AEC family transporter [Dorea longicatena]NSD40814.1 AEC family transporter [Dorea longicatena]NSD70175.1 AEC family transporter [Dorea longicatena]NSD72951.1 AEC family transporter [Dorea longicatena]